jgi:hypothetical protein
MSQRCLDLGRQFFGGVHLRTIISKITWQCTLTLPHDRVREQPLVLAIRYAAPVQVAALF